MEGRASNFVTDSVYEKPTTREFLEDLNYESNESMDEETTTKVQGLKIIDVVEQPQELETDFPKLFDKVTPNRIHNIIHELTTSKGMDGMTSNKLYFNGSIKSFQRLGGHLQILR